MSAKTCTKCGVEKEVGEFSLRGYKRKDGVPSLSSWCRLCQSEHGAKYRKANKSRLLKKIRDNYSADPEKFRKCSREWRRKNPGKALATSRRCQEKKDRFVTALQSSRRAAKNGSYMPCSATLEEIRSAYTGRCEVCGVPDLECSGKFHMDHNHETGEFRGWLCGNCNKGLGFLKDSEELLINALHFLMNCGQKI